jgi:hypothetical protein
MLQKGQRQMGKQWQILSGPMVASWLGYSKAYRLLFLGPMPHLRLVIKSLRWLRTRRRENFLGWFTKAQGNTGSKANISDLLQTVPEWAGSSI